MTDKSRIHLSLTDENLKKAVKKAKQESISPIKSVSQAVDYILAWFLRNN